MGLMGLFRRGDAVEDTTVMVGAAGAGRRERVVDTGGDLVVEALATKLLHGWLQNRHQTLMPLNLNLSVLARDQQEGLARILASLLVAGRPESEAAEFAPVLRSWLAGLGADAAVLDHFDAAITAPWPLNVLFETAQTYGLMVYAYVAALMASDPRYPVSIMLCEVVQARFDLPTAIIRSAIRRYRR